MIIIIMCVCVCTYARVCVCVCVCVYMCGYITMHCVEGMHYISYTVKLASIIIIIMPPIKATIIKVALYNYVLYVTSYAGLQKLGISAQNTHVQKIVLFLAIGLVDDKQIL